MGVAGACYWGQCHGEPLYCAKSLCMLGPYH
jgi:hypothetical protein